MQSGSLLRSCLCSQSMLESAPFQKWAVALGELRLHMHRKIWEYCYISQALHERGLLRPGVRGLGFAVGQEPLSALFASHGCEIVATDLDTQAADSQGNWVQTGQHAASLRDLNMRGLCPEREFQQRVTFRFVDMNAIPDALTGFDFIWSSCSLEHLGSIDQGKRFVYNSLGCLRPGGIAVHTTEYNLSSNQETVEQGWTVVFRRQDIEEVGRALASLGHGIDLEFAEGNAPLDLLPEEPPFAHRIHLRAEILGYVCTSYGMIIQKSL